MSLDKSLWMSAALLLGTTAVAYAQPFYQWYGYQPYGYYQGYPFGAVAATTPSWSYDPYTSGLTACPQWRRGDPPCRDTMFPTFGQPDYRAR